VSATPLTDHTDGAVIYIAATGKPYPVEVIGGKGTQAVGKFSEWDKAFSVAAPPSSQTYALSLG
jgi:hypothetical protein